MKKFVLILGLVLILSGCESDKTPTTVEDFLDYANAMEMKTVDATGQFPEGAVESVTIAYNDKFQVEFYIVPTEEQAKDAFDQNVTAFENAFTGSSSHVSTELGNNGSYAATDDNYYYLVSRIDNTFFYVVAEKAYKDEIKDYLEHFDY
ncbi:MAG: lipoprotein [Clostridia bacterium]|nr:lipoprotein [Clostridia bacterium]